MFRGNFTTVISRVLVVVLLFGSVFVATSGQAVAAVGPANGFLVSPVEEELTINKGTSQTVDIAVQNPTNSTVVAETVINDFVASSQENGVPRILLNGDNSPANNFKSLVKPIPNTTLSPQQKQYIPVTISVPANASSGGYYGVVRFIPVLNNNSAANVGLTASVGSLFLITVPGNLIQKLDLVQLSAANNNGNADSFFLSGAVSSMVRLHNSGNIHVEPFGSVVVKNMFGSQVASYQFNNTDPRASILPDSTRKFVNALPSHFWFGHYTIDANLAYVQGSGKIITASAGFWYMPWWSLIVLVVILAVIVYFVRRLVIRRRRHHLQGGKSIPVR
jgi:hypothetical protein